MALYPAIRPVLALGIVLLAGCAPSIPSKVTPEEYALYSQWTSEHFETKAPEKLFFSSRTFIFDPLEAYRCGNTLHASDGVPWSLMKRLHELGQAEYPLDFYTAGSMRIPWHYKEMDTPNETPGTFHLIGFSRVSFNRDHSEALFAISDSCAAGDCGGGGALIAKREKGKWTFRRPASCSWMY